MPEEIPSNMKDSWFFDKSFNGMSDETFDDVLKFFDFPLEDVEANVVEEDWDTQFNHLEVPCFDAFSVSSAGLFGRTQNEKPQFGNGLPASVTCNGISPIKQETEIARPSSYGKTIRNQNVSFNDKVLHRFQTYSPVSVFENSSSSSVEISNFDKPTFPVKRARSKRHQRTSFGPLFSFSFFPNSPGLQKNQEESTPESSSETRTAWKHLNRIKKQRKKDLSLLSGDVEMKRSSSQEPVSHRKCTHCEITKTPQWREGPMGPKTLCNACGVRYRSGRLFPEYRPAASPTFVASVHSNSHKRVLEMRGKDVPDGVRGSTSMSSPSSDLPGSYVG